MSSQSLGEAVHSPYEVSGDGMFLSADDVWPGVYSHGHMEALWVQLLDLTDEGGDPEDEVEHVVEDQALKCHLCVHLWRRPCPSGVPTGAPPPLLRLFWSSLPI